jgi:signal transduction histidine kinase/CheY-like chemotaxis protein
VAPYRRAPRTGKFRAVPNLATAAALVAAALLAVVLLLVRRLRVVSRQRARLAEETVALQRARQADMAARLAHLERERGSPLHGLLTRRLGTFEAVAESIARDLEQARAGPPEVLAAAAARAALRAGQLARLAAGGRAREPRTTLPSIWPRAQALVQPKLEAHHTLRATFAPDLLPVVGGGEEWVQMLVALLENAIEATAAGGLVEVSAENGNGVARIRVSDTGRGIRPEILPHVTEPFYTSRAELGADGLGLSMVAALVEGMGGSLLLASKVGEGTTVELTVPTAALDAAPAVLTLRGAFLVADDDLAVRGGVARMLRSFGADAVEVDSGSAARQRLTADDARFDGAILDVVMPGTPVGDVVAEARSRDPRFPVLLISGYDTMRMVDGILALGGVRFLRKPFTREELHGALADLLGQRSAGDAAH